MGLIGPKQYELFALHLQLLYLTRFTLAFTCVYDANLKKLFVWTKSYDALLISTNFAQQMPLGLLQALPRA